MSVRVVCQNRVKGYTMAVVYNDDKFVHKIEVQQFLTCEQVMDMVLEFEAENPHLFTSKDKNEKK